MADTGSGRRGRTGLSARTARTARTARGAAVALALGAGVIATVATTPPSDPPCPPTNAEISDFYGAQEEDRGDKEWSAEGENATTGPFEWSNVRAEVRSCVAEDEETGTTPVTVLLHLTDDGSGPGYESFLRAAVLVDGDGRTWTVTDLRVGDDQMVTERNGLPVRQVVLQFDLPLDVAEPVTLRLPDLDGPEGGRLKPLRIGPFWPYVDEPTSAGTPWP